MCFFNYNNISHNNTKQLKKRNIEKYINGVRNRVEFQVKNWKKEKMCQLHPVFPGGHPSKY